RKPTIQLFLKTPADARLRSLDLPWSDDSHSIGPVILIVKTSTTIVIKRPSSLPEPTWNPRTWFQTEKRKAAVEMTTGEIAAIEFVDPCGQPKPCAPQQQQSPRAPNLGL